MLPLAPGMKLLAGAVVMTLASSFLVSADVIVTMQNRSVNFLSKDSSFGPGLPDRGLSGRLLFVNPVYACGDVLPAPVSENETKWIAIVSRHNCTFVEKVLNVQKAGYVGAIVHNVASNAVLSMGGSPGQDHVKIPSVFIGQFSADYMLKYNGSLEAFVTLVGEYDPNTAAYFLLPFVVVVALCLLVVSTFLIVRCAVDYYRKSKTRLSSSNLKKLPIKKFKKGAEVDVCAVCLDEYEDGDKLRVLPCGHEYHQKCIDPWLTKNKKTCPLCKRKVFSSDESDSETEHSTPAGENNSERTPLLLADARSPGTGRNTGGAGSRRPRYGVNSPRRPTAGAAAALVVTDSSDSDDSGLTASGRYQSSVEVHQCPRSMAADDLQHSINNSSSVEVHVSQPSRHGASSGRARPRAQVIDETSASLNGAELEGAVGGAAAAVEPGAIGVECNRRAKNRKKRHGQQDYQGLTNEGFDVVGDHFREEAGPPREVGPPREAGPSSANQGEARMKEPRSRGRRGATDSQPAVVRSQGDDSEAAEPAAATNAAAAATNAAAAVPSSGSSRRNKDKKAKETKRKKSQDSSEVTIVGPGDVRSPDGNDDQDGGRGGGVPGDNAAIV